MNAREQIENEADRLRQPLAALLGYLYATGMDDDSIREIVYVHACDRVPVESQRAFIDAALALEGTQS